MPTCCVATTDLVRATPLIQRRRSHGTTDVVAILFRNMGSGIPAQRNITTAAHMDKAKRGDDEDDTGDDQRRDPERAVFPDLPAN